MALSVKVDWNKDGDYSDTGETVTTRVMENPGLSLSYGRDQITALAPTVAGTGSFTLNNASNDYNPLNASSPIYGYIKPARPVQIQRTVGGNTYTLFDGHTDDTPLNPDLSSQTVTVSLVDYLADFRGQTVTTSMYSGVRTGTAIGYILDELGWSATLRDIDPGVTIMPWWYEAGEDAFTALEKILQSEGPPALLTMAPGNILTFRDRHHRLLNTASTTSQDTWYGATTKPVMITPFTYDAGWRNIVNNASQDIDVQTLTGLAEVWASDTQITMSDGEVRILNASVTGAVASAVTPVEGTDFTVLSGAVAVALIADSGPTIPIRLTATGATVLSGMRLRAIALNTAYAVRVEVADSTSITDYGKRDYPTDVPWCNQYDAEAVFTNVISTRAQPLAIIEAQFACTSSDTTTSDAILARNLSDRVTVTSTAMGLNSDFYIENFKHDFGNELDHMVTVGCEAVQATQSTALQFDVASHGFDDGAFGTGIDDPTTMFLLDSSTSGHRFDEGLFCR